MSRNGIFLFLTVSPGVVASALTLGCGDRTGVTEPVRGTAPSYGAAVDRFQAPWPEVFVDPETGLTLVAGAAFDPEQLFEIFCPGLPFTERADWLAVTHPGGGGGTVTHVRIKDQDQSVIVWAATPADICEELILTDVPPLAVGTARLTFTDNDFAGTSSHADSFGQRIEGMVTNPTTGQRYHLEMAYRAVALPDGTFMFTVTPFVRLTPIGE
jgi:hypothetical protein